MNNKDLFNHSNNIVDLSKFRKSPVSAANASRPKYILDTAEGVAYFKFDITTNEICAEILSYEIAKSLQIPCARTYLAKYRNKEGIVSYDIGPYIQPCDDEGYSVKDFIHLEGFIEMCLFDYLIMNEDRHPGNWGITVDNLSVAPLYDHNVCFGQDRIPNDFYYFMPNLTTSFYAEFEYEQLHDTVLRFLCVNYGNKVMEFVSKIKDVESVNLKDNYPDNYNKIKDLYRFRIGYMKERVGEFIEQ